MTSYICVTCGTQYPAAEKAPAHCPICEDERQYVGLNGQEWISLDALRKAHRNVVFEEGERLWGIHTQPKFAIGQRALLLQSAQGGFLWDCVSLIDEETVGLVKERGGIRGMAISHPHYYTSMVEWSRAFGGVPIYLHEADRKWVQHPDPAIEFWSGDTKKVSDDLTLIRVGGHFDGFQVLHWASGEQGKRRADDRRYAAGLSGPAVREFHVQLSEFCAGECDNSARYRTQVGAVRVFETAWCVAEVRGGGRSERSPAAIGRAVLEGVRRKGAVMGGDSARPDEPGLYRLPSPVTKSPSDEK